MRLQRIELKGFKSFASETHIIFDEDIIGVVGPNGSGKSNIVDAVRWVLGEQSSRELRLESMGDVIFNGSKKRKAGKLASVSLTFENTKNLLPTEFNEVTLTRKLFRSGESEYRINDVKCRLKDIHNLFMDSGIGSNSYAIIALGMVDDILADKENARRQMFEQAAGISKYKQRKKETLKKLSHTEEDLNRIEDLVFEIEKNLKSLERQARRTKRFYEIKGEFKELSIQLGGIRVGRIKKKLDELNSQLERETEAYRSLEAEITNRESKVEEGKKENLDKESELSAAQKNINKVVGEIRGLEEEKRILGQQLTYRKNELNELKAKIEEFGVEKMNLKEGITLLASRLEKENRKLQDVRVEKADSATKMETLKVDYESGKASVDSQYNQIREKEKNVLNLERDIEIQRSKDQTLKTEKEKITQRIQEKEDWLEKENKWLGNVDKDVQKLSKQINTLEEEIFRKNSRKEELEEEEESIVKLLQRHSRKLDARTNEQKLLKDFVSKMEGFPESIKYLTKNNSWKSSFALLSDIITAKAPYRSILEDYLGDYLNYFVVDRYQDAASAIHILKENEKGRGNFLILEEWITRSQLELFNVDGLIPALEIVEYDSKYEALISNLLGNVFFAKPEFFTEDAELAENAVYLSMDGTIHRQKGKTSGGNVGLFEGSKLGRKQQIVQLDREITDINGEIEGCEEQLDALNDEIQDLETNEEEDQLEQLSSERRKLESQKMKIETTVEVTGNEIQSLRGELEAVLNKEKEDRENIEELNEKLRVSNSKLEELQSELAGIDESYNRISTEYNEIRQIFNDVNIREIQQANLVDQLQREFEYKSDRLKELQQNEGQNQNKIISTEEAIEDLNRSQGNIDSQLLELLDARKEKESNLNEVEKKYYQSRMEITEMENEIKKLNQKQRNSQTVINQLKDQLNSDKFEFKRITERLNIEFGVEENDLILGDPGEEKGTEDELTPRIEKLKNRLDNYGEINPLAVEAYDEITNRHQTIISQRDDVLEARDKLVETINEIENTATQKFMEAFESVRTNFIDVFRRLFTEDDDCDLVLLDPDNPLESKIEITAKPKGKKPKSISQLSGGEKTLTATALLFALYLLKPAPFCIFDEVDAPLDDANIYKFNRIIKEFSGDSQFIIVTHNKLTMEAVDIIYGVFMEDTGVSNVAAVDFRHLDEVAEFAVSGGG